ncbi:MAG: type I restriction enzyme HsdR N-terminal domain-containing protein [Rhodopila sp.]|jgi:hypothetical protein
MPVKQLTTWPTESDLEAAIEAGLKRAFPWLPKESIRHQTKFAFSFGRSTIEVDGTTASRSEARADILLHWGDEPLAVLELKRASVPLTAEDKAQGLSYARMLHPRPPLVVVTNGVDVQFLETHTGNDWAPSEPGEAAFKQLLESASRASVIDLKQAVSTLMGSSPDIWVQAVRQASTLIIDELSGPWSNATLPFVRDFLIPRRATSVVLVLLRRGSRLITVEGTPIVGKSNVLRELVAQTGSSGDKIVLYLEADSGGGVFQALANVFRSAISWPVTREEAREWALRLSKAGGPALVLAIDGLGAERDDPHRDIEDLTSVAFGEGIQVVAALDDVIAERVTLNSTGRNASAIGRRADRVKLGLLDNDEFAQARAVLWENGLAVIAGAESAEELRVPWVLRAAGACYEESPRRRDENLAAGIPPLLGLELIVHAREQFTDDELRRLFRGVAEAAIADASDRKRPVGLILQSLAVFVVRRKTLRNSLEAAEIDVLIDRALLRPYQPPSGEPLLIARHSELLASEIADLLGRELATRAQKDPTQAADWIAGAAANFPLGDVVAAQAILDATMRHGGLPIQVIVALLETPPQRHAVKPGTRTAVYFPGIGSFDMTFREGGSIDVEVSGRRHVIEADPDEEAPCFYGDYHPWLILSHLAGKPFIWGSDLEDRAARVDPMLLLEVGSCPTVLRLPGGTPGLASLPIHDIPGVGSIVCHEAGIVEPITWSIFRFLITEGKGAEDWVQEAVKRESLPLLARIDIALRSVALTAAPRVAPWAQQALETCVRPALLALPPLHPGDAE